MAIHPEQVAVLTQAQSSGRLSLSLVGTEGDTISSAFQIDQDILLGIEAEEVTAALEEKNVWKIKTRHVAEVVVIPIPCTN